MSHVIVESIWNHWAHLPIDSYFGSTGRIADRTPTQEAISESMEEAVAEDPQVRLRTGIFTQRDADFLLRANHATLSGAFGRKAALRD